MTFGSLFAGIGGFDLGLERAGLTCVWQVECNDFCVAILERHWPHVYRRKDVRCANATNLVPVDCIVGGFPCQDVSAAGKGAGVEAGHRSGLWREFARIVCELSARWVVVENVPALRTRGADAVLGDLEAAGYACWPVVVGAHHVGAPQRRDRVWIIARLANGERAGLERRADAGQAQKSESWDGGDMANAGRDGIRDESGRGGGPRGARTSIAADVGDLANGNGNGCESQRRAGLRDDASACGDDANRRDRWPARPGEPQYDWEPARAIESRVGCGAHGFSARLAARRRRNELKALGNAVVPQCAELIGRTILALEGACCPVCGSAAPLVSCQWCGERTCGSDDCWRAVHDDARTCAKRPADRARGYDGPPDDDITW